MNYTALREQLILDEGIRFRPYPDTEGKMTIGVGRNLSDNGLTRDEIMFLLDNDIATAINDLDRVLPWWRTMNSVRQNVIVNMCFNLGITRLVGFKKALAAMEKGDYETAAREMENSAWYTQVGPRAYRLVSLMRSGA